MSARASADPKPAGPLAFVIACAAPWRGQLTLSVLAAAISAIASFAPLLAIGIVTAAVFGEGNIPWAPVLALMIGGGLVQFAGASAANMLGHALAFRVQEDVRLRLVDVLSRAPVSSVESRASEWKKLVLGDVGRFEGLLAHVIPDIVAGLSAVLTGCVILTFIDWRMTLAALALAPVAVLAQIWTLRGAPDMYARWNTTETAVNEALLGYVQGVATLRAFNRDASSLAHVRSSVLTLRDLAVDISRGARFPWSLFSGVLATNLLVVLPAAMALHASGAITLAQAALAIMVGAGALAPLGKVVFATQVAARTAAAASRVQDALALAKTGAEEAMPFALAPASPGCPPLGEAAIRFDSVTFSYPDGRPGLVDTNCVIPLTGHTAIVGPSGSGKSTLARMLLGLDAPSDGAIRIVPESGPATADGATAPAMAAVFQNSVLFAGSIGDNVAMAAHEASQTARRRRAEAALQSAHADDIAGTLAASMAREVGERGRNLSGGERQRVAIARAMASDAGMLVLDEATAAIDPSAAYAVNLAIAAASVGHAVVNITHRVDRVSGADHIIVLNAGRVEAEGVHTDLLAHSATYRMLLAAAKSSQCANSGAGATAC